MDWKSVQFDWNRARAFLVVAEEGSLSAAARALQLTQPTIGRQIVALEEELHVTLFARTGKGMTLTESGMELLESARAMGQAAMHFSMAASGQAESIQGLVCLSVGELDAFFRLPPLLASLRQTQPQIELDIISSNTISDLKRREADIALRNFLPNQDDLIAKKVAEDRIWLYGTTQVVSQLPPTPQHKDFCNVRIFGYERSPWLLERLKGKGWSVSSDSFPVTSPSQLVQWQMAKQGTGLIFLPEDIGDSDDTLQRAFADVEPVEIIPLWVVSHRELRTNRRVRYVFDAVAEYYLSYQT